MKRFVIFLLIFFAFACSEIENPLENKEPESIQTIVYKVSNIGVGLTNSNRIKADNPRGYFYVYEDSVEIEISFSYGWVNYSRDVNIKEKGELTHEFGRINNVPDVNPMPTGIESIKAFQESIIIFYIGDSLRYVNNDFENGSLIVTAIKGSSD